MSQISNLSFSVRFEAHNPNKVILTDTTPVLPAGYVGIFKVIQPDGYVREGNINTPDVNTVTRVAEIALIPDSKGQIQKGQYVIELTALAPGYLSTTFTRTFAFQYTPATVKLRNDFDLFTPKLQYTDITNYAVSDYNLTSGPTRSWNVTSPTTGAITGTAATIDLKKNDKYYAENYAIGFSVSLVYANQSLSWLTVAHNQSASETVNACVPKPLDELTQSIDALRVESNEACGGDWDKFEKASTLYSHLFSMLRLVLVDEQFQPGFYDVYQQLLSLLNNGQTFCNSIGNEILPYDFINYESSVSVGLASETDGVVITDTPVTTVGVLKINIDTASAEGPGLLSDEDWMIFNAKQDFITPGTTAQYWRGDKTWQTLNTSVVPEGTNLYFTNTRARQAVSLTTNGNSGASTYDNATGVFNIPNYTLAGLGGVPSARVLTINGLAQDLSADRTWNVGTVTSISTTGPITGGPITGSGTIGITQSGASSDGYLSSTDWNVFNSKEPYIAPGTTAQYWRGDKTWQTLNTAVVPESTNLYYTDARARLAISLTTNGNSGPSTYNNTTGVLNVPNYTLAGLGGVPLTRSLTINGTTYDLSGDRTWNVGTVTGSGTLNYVAKWTPDGTALGNSQIFDNGTNVGIGTVSPSFSLDVQTASARVRVKPSTSTNYALFQAENAGNIAYLGIDNSAGALSGTAYALNVYHNGAYPIVFSTSGVNRMWVSSVGNVGVGTASPSSKLQVVGGVTAQSALLSHAMPNGDVIAWFDNNNTTTDQSFGLLIDAGTSANDYALRVRNAATTELFRITGAGNVGIGTAIPSQSLHVVGRQRIDTPSANTSSITPSLISDSAITISATGNDNITGNLTAGISFGEPAGRYAAIYGYDDGASQSQGLLFITGNNSSVSGRLKIASTGSITASSLSGSGVRMVTADATGTLGTQDITGGVVLGSGTLNYVAKWTPNGTTLGISSIFDDGTYVGVGTASPSARVDIRGASTLVGVRYIENTTGNTNRIQLGAEAGVGYIEATAGVGSPVLSIRVAGSERARIYATGNMFVGPSPADSGYRLDVSGNARINASAGNTYAFYVNDSGTNVNQFVDFDIAKGMGAYAYYRFAAANQNIITWGRNLSPYTDTLGLNSPFGNVDIQTGGTSRIRVLSSNGNVGINNTNPSARLHVSTTFTDSAIEEAVRIQRSGLSSYNGERQIGLVFADDANFTLTSAISGLRNNPTGHYLGGITFRVSTSVSTAVTTIGGLTEVARLTSDGRFGVNTTAPVARVHAQGTQQDAPQTIARFAANNASGQIKAMDFQVNAGSSLFVFNTAYAGTAMGVDFADAGTSRMRIGAGGNVGIGTASPAARLDVYETSASNQQLILRNAGTYHTGFGATSTSNILTDTKAWGIYGGPNSYLTGAADGVGLIISSDVPFFQIQKNTNLNSGTPTVLMRVASTGTITATSLAGTGTRMVVADANGVLSTQSLGSGAVTGTGTLNYVAKWTPNGATLGDSSIFDDGSRIGISRSNPSYKVDLLTSTDGFDGFNVNNNNAGVNAISGYRAINGNGIGLIMGVTEFSASSALGGANQAVIYNVGSQALIFGTSSIERMRIFNNGRVGINTGATDQGSALQVVGSLYNSASAVLAASSGNVFIGATTAAISTGLKYAYIEGGIAGIGPEVVLHNTVAQDTAEMAISFTGVRSGAGVASQIKSTRRGILTFHTQDLPSATPSTPAERMRVASDGNVAIGTTNTGYGKLGVYDATNSLLGVANSTSYAQLQQNGADLYINTNLSGAAGGNLIFRFGSGVTERMRVYSTGNVFIGSSPVDNGYRLDVSGNLSVRTGKIDVIANTEFAMNLNRADVTPVAFQAFNSGSNGWIIMGAESSSGGGLFTGSSAYASVVGSASNRPLQFATNSIVRMTVSNSGNVGIGVTPSPWSGVSASLQLGVSPFIASTGQYLFVSSNSYYNGTNAIYTSNGASAQYSQYEGSHMWYTASSGTAGNVVTLNERLRISSTGSITASSLAGTGTRMVVADANGVLSTQSLGSGSVAGSGTLNYVAKWTPDGATLGNSQIFDNGTNVGIGTTTPGARLDVSGGQTLTANFNFSGNGTYVRWQNNGTSFGDIGSGATLVSGGSVNDFAIHARSGNNIVFSTNFSEKMRIFANGRVGIGTNSTDYGHALQVIGNIYSNSNLIVDGNYRSNTGATALTASTGLNYIGKGDNTRFSGFNFQGVAASDMFFGRTANSDDLVISTSNTGSPAERVRFTQSGNVGIGVTPSAWTWRALQVGTTAVASTSTVGFLSANAYFDGAYKYTTTGSAQVLEVNNGNEFRFLTAGSGTAGSAVTFTQAMTVFSNGNVSVGNSTNAGYKFDVFGGNARVYGSGLFVEQGSGFQTAIALNQVGVRQWVIRNVATSALFAINDGSFDRLVINGSTGNVGIGTTSPDYALEVERAGVSDIVSNSTVDSNSAIVSTYNSSATSLNFMQMRSYGNATGTTLFGTSTNKMNALFSNADSSMAMGTISATPVIFGTSNAHRMRITPDGYVLINRTSSVAADYFLQINGQTYGESTVAFKQTGNLAAYFLNTISVPNAATFNGGTAWSGVRSINDMTFNGSVTIPDAAVVGGAVNANRISFATASNTITMTQTGNSVRAIAGFQILNQFAGANSGTISHGAGILVQGVDRVGGGSTLTFTNYYGIAINDMNEFGEASFTNRWGVYQAGTTDKNYFAARTLIGSNVDGGGGQILQVTGNALITGTVRTGAPAGGTSGAWKLGSYVSSTTTFDTTGYLEVEVDGGTYMIALSAGNPT